MNSLDEQSQRIERIPLVDEARPASRRQQIGFLVRVTLLVIAVVLGYKLVRAALYGLSAMNSAYAILKLREDGDLNADDLVRGQADMAEVARATTALERELRLFAPIFNGAEIIPKIGPTIGAVPELLAAGKDLAVIGNESLKLIAPVAAARPDAPLTEVLLQSMAENGDLYALLGQRAQSASATLSTLQPDQLAPRLAGPVAQLQAAVTLLAAGLQLGPELPALAGFDRPKTYLVVVQNNQELRGTGGFISAVGQVTVDKGDIGAVELTDSYNIQRNDVDHPWAPDPMREYMGIDLIFLRDANWSPDFPTTAQLARALYQQDGGVAVDGVLSVDMHAVEHLIAALGSLEVPGSDVAITRDNLVDQLKLFWDQPLEAEGQSEDAEFRDWWTQRKDFMPAIASAALARVQNGNFDLLSMVGELLQALDGRAIQIWTTQPETSDKLAALGWDGGIQPVAGADFVALVDTNMGYNKVDAVLQRSLAHTVTWPDGPDAPALATTTITYTHPITNVNVECARLQQPYGENYDEMFQRCYFDYVRLYTPAGSTLVGIEGVEPDSVTSMPGEQGTQVLAGYFTMKPGTEHTVTFTYRLPPAFTPAAYQVVVQRQSGTEPLPVTLAAGDARMATTLDEAELHWSPTN